MVQTVIDTMSQDRFRTYLHAAGFDPERALRLYLWNAEVGGAFHLPIQAVEVSLRNRISLTLAATFGQEWWRSSAFNRLVDREREQDLALVQRRIENRGLSLVAGQVVAGLSLGFWVGMLRARYNPSIWSGNIRSAFPLKPHSVGRDDMFKAAGQVAALRNRISHHEPIIKADVGSEFSNMMTLLKWICPRTHDWIRPHCRVPELMRQKP
jgi:hypothetical protein